MNPWDLRMLDGKTTPDSASAAKWIGPAYKHWTRIQRFIEANYPGVFAPDWWFGGKRFGWSLRYKKSKSFCNLIPEKGRMMVMLTFGRDERSKIEPELSRLTPRVKAAYEAAPTFHDGKWLALPIDGPGALSDVEALLVLKRRPIQSSQPMRMSVTSRAEPRVAPAGGAAKTKD
jgi:hypothetical protein